MKDKYILFADAKSTHTVKWLKELIKYFDVYLISLNGYSNEVLEYLSKEKIYVLNSSVKQAGGNFKLISKYFELKKIVDKIKPKYINAHYLSSYGFLAALLKRDANFKLIQSTWGSDILVSPFQNKIKFYIAKYALKKANLITSDSFYMSDKIKEIYKNSKIMTFPFGLDEFEIKEYKKDEFLIFSNRILSKNYNIDKIIRWLATINSNYKLVIANSGDMLEDLKILAKELKVDKQVEFVGFLSKAKQENYYKEAKYYISIPTSDSTAVSLLEAMRYGCCPIVSNIAANKEWVRDGINGYIFKQNLQLNKAIDVVEANQKTIKQRAIFKNSIKEFVKRVHSL